MKIFFFKKMLEGIFYKINIVLRFYLIIGIFYYEDILLWRFFILNKYI